MFLDARYKLFYNLQNIFLSSSLPAHLFFECEYVANYVPINEL